MAEKTDVSLLLKKIGDASIKRLTTTKKPAGKEIDPNLERHKIAAADAGKARQRAKEAEKNLTVANELLAEKEEEIKTLKETITAKDAAIAELKPNADSWKKFESKERAALEAKLPPELKADAKGMSLQHLRLFADRAGTAGEGKGAGSGGAKGGDIDAQMEEAVKKGDSDAINALLDKATGKGEKKESA